MTKYPMYHATVYPPWISVNYYPVDLLADAPFYGNRLCYGNRSLVEITSRRLSAVTVDFPDFQLLLINIYMPTDAMYDKQNTIVFNDILAEISAIGERLGIDHIVIGGDMNSDFCRTQSPHTVFLLRFLDRESLFEPDSHIIYTYETLSNGEHSRLDHFFLSDNFLSIVTEYTVLHEGDNLSDHSAISIALSIPECYVDPSVRSLKQGKLNWRIASD